MTKTKIAFQGEAGANSHIACRTLYPDMDALPCTRFDDVFAATTDGTAALAMIPIENTVAGRVADIHRLLPGGGLYIIGEYFMPIHHCLLAKKGVGEASLTHVHSHEMALGQCRGLISDLALTPVVAADTAGAARWLAAEGAPSHAAIAGALAGEIYQLDILRENIEDSKSNTTRFLIMANSRQDVPYLTNAEGSVEDAEGSAKKTEDKKLIITSFIFRVKNQPAALYKALGAFASNGVNMTKLESYQPDGFLATQFYADIEGHVEDANTARALNALKEQCDNLEILGSYKASPFRASLL